MKNVLCALLFLSPVFALAEAPVAVTEEIAPIADLTLEVSEQVERLAGVLTEEKYEDAKDGDVRQAFGLLACIGQALADHDKADGVEIQGAALRDAALQYKRKASLEDAQKAFEAVKVAVAGKAEGDFSKEHPWNKLVNMHPMMEEMNDRNSKILRVLRRPRGKADEPIHATTWVVLSLAMHADTHEVKNEADIPKWHQFSDDFREAAIKLGEAIRAKDKDEGKKWFDKANESCDACHEVFQD